MFIMYECVMVPVPNGYAASVPDLGITVGERSLELTAAHAYNAIVASCGRALGRGEDLPAATTGNQADGGIVLTICTEVTPISGEDGWMSASEAACFLGISAEHARALVREGILDGHKQKGVWRIVRASVAARRIDPPRRGRPRTRLCG